MCYKLTGHGTQEYLGTRMYEWGMGTLYIKGGAQGGISLVLVVERVT